MTVRVIRSFGPYECGTTFNPPDGQADLLIRRGFVEPCDEKQEESKKAASKRTHRR